MPLSHSSVVGGSSAARVLACPGSVGLAAQAPKKAGSPWAEEGTALHSAMEHLLEARTRRKPNPRKVLGMSFNNHVMTSDLIDSAIAPALDHFWDRLGRHRSPYELEVTAPFPGIDGAFGTTDVVARPTHEVLVIWDWKFGAGVPVSAENNAQGLFYGACMLEHYGAWDTVKRVDINICQPRVADGNSRWVVDVTQVRAFCRALRRALRRSDLSSGPHCRWCPAAAYNCPLKREEAETALAIKASGPQLEEAMNMVARLKHWIAAVEVATFEALQAGAVMSQWKLVEKKAARKWALDDTRVRAYLDSTGLTPDQYAPRKTITAPAAEKLLKTVGQRLKDDVVVKEKTGLTLAPKSDNRPAMNTGRNLKSLAAAIHKTGDQSG